MYIMAHTRRIGKSVGICILYAYINTYTCERVCTKYKEKIYKKKEASVRRGNSTHAEGV